MAMSGWAMKKPRHLKLRKEKVRAIVKNLKTSWLL
jgi:hypothetical protein